MKPFIPSACLLLIILTWFACNNTEDEPACIQSDWVGTYEGTLTCDVNTTAVTVTIRAGDMDAILIEYEFQDGATNTTIVFDPITPDACSIDEMGSNNGLTARIDATLDGDNLTLIESLSDGVNTDSCEIMATRI